MNYLGNFRKIFPLIAKGSICRKNKLSEEKWKRGSDFLHRKVRGRTVDFSVENVDNRNFSTFSTGFSTGDFHREKHMVGNFGRKNTKKGKPGKTQPFIPSLFEQKPEEGA